MKSGVPIAPRTAFDWSLAERELKGAARDFYLLNGKAPQVGQLFKAPMQAKVCKRLPWVLSLTVISRIKRIAPVI